MKPRSAEVCVWYLPAERAGLYLERALALLTLPLLGLWAWQWAGAAGVAAWLAAAAVLWFGLGRFEAPAGQGEWALAFDGSHWLWWPQGSSTDEVPPCSGRIRVALEFGPWLLLRAQAARGAGASTWLLVRPGRLGSSGRELRAALIWS